MHYVKIVHGHVSKVVGVTGTSAGWNFIEWAAVSRSIEWSIVYKIDQLFYWAIKLSVCSACLTDRWFDNGVQLAAA